MHDKYISLSRRKGAKDDGNLRIKCPENYFLVCKKYLLFVLVLRKCGRSFLVVMTIIVVYF